MADGLAVVMLGVAVFCGSRMVLAAAWHRPTPHDVDLVHVAMGISMAGMLTGSLAGRWTDVWLVTFSLSTAWFGYRALGELDGDRPARSGCDHVPHLVGSAAMLYMLIAMQWAPMGANGTAAPGGAGPRTLPVIVSVLLVLNALLSAGRAFSSSRSLGAVALSGGAGVGGPVSTQGRRWAGRGGGDAFIAPRCGSLCLLAMSGAMTFMLVTLRP